MRGRQLATGVTALVVLGLAVDGSVGTRAAFSGTAGSVAGTFSSAPDWLPPQVGRATVLKAEGGIPGFIRQGGAYRVHAAVVDDTSSRPASGVGTVTAGITGLPSMDLAAGAATIEGQAYTHQTPLRTEAYAPPGSYAAWVHATDQAVPSNTSEDLALQVVVDNTAPAGAELTVVNGGTVRRADAGDRVTFTWGEIVDPHSVVPAWTGAAVDVTVRITDSALAGGDLLTVWNAANNAQLPLGQVALGGNYVTATTNFGAAGAATRSRLSWSAAPGTGFTVVLGPPNAPGNVVAGSTTATTTTWTPSATVFDRAGNRSSTTAVVEAGIADRDF